MITKYKSRFLRGVIPENINLLGTYKAYLHAPFFPKINFLNYQKKFTKDGESLKGMNSIIGVDEIGYFNVKVAESFLFEGVDVIQLDYNLPQNPKRLRRHTDELRQINQNEYMGVGVHHLKNTDIWALWFSIHRQLKE